MRYEVVGQFRSPSDCPLALLVRSTIWVRGRRRRFVNGDLFADPAWDMLLELFASLLEQRPVSVSKLCHASGVPDTTALRWIRRLEEEHLVVRTPDASDARRVFVGLSSEGEKVMRDYFESLPPGAVIL